MGWRSLIYVRRCPHSGVERYALIQDSLALTLNPKEIHAAMQRARES